MPVVQFEFLRRERVGEALVVAEVEVGFAAIVGDVDLAVLVRAHRAGVDVDVRVELLQRDLVAVSLEQAPIEAAASPLPSDDTTPPVTKMYLVAVMCESPGACISVLTSVRTPALQQAAHLFEILRRVHAESSRTPFRRP